MSKGVLRVEDKKLVVIAKTMIKLLPDGRVSGPVAQKRLVLAWTQIPFTILSSKRFFSLNQNNVGGKAMSIEQFLLDNEIPHSTSGKHARPGWIQIECPFCEGHEGYHGGFNIKDIYFNCWRCGWHSLSEVIQTLIGCTYYEAKKTIKDYDIYNSSDLTTDVKVVPSSLTLPKIADFPPGYPYNLSSRHIQYLKWRGFDLDDLLPQGYGIYSASNIGDYKFRLVIPIIFEGRIVSFTTRSTSGQEPKYLSCPKAEELIHHKHLLYGMDFAWSPDNVGVRAPKHRVIVVEGPMDVWRFKRETVATFGIQYTRQQLLMLVKKFSHIHIVFDNETQAQMQAYKLAAEIMGLGRQAKVHELPATYNDPADMPQEEADKFVTNILSS